MAVEKKKVSAKKAPAKKASAKKVPAKEAPAKKAPAKRAPPAKKAKPAKKASVSDFSSMTAGALKALCIKAGLKYSGKKADLVARLEEHEAGGGEEDDDEEEEEEEEEAPPKKKAKVTKKAETKTASAPAKGERRGPRPDRLVPDKDVMEVHGDFNIKLNQTNIGGNNNKFYIIQLLQNGGTYYVWTRWGRVGENGANNLDNKGTDLAAAIQGFEKKFKDKTKNQWHDRDNFVKHSGKYQLVEVEEGGDDEDDSPMGRLTKTQIEKGQKVLESLEKVLTKEPKSSEVVKMSSQFFSLIPTNFGRQRPEPIRTIDALKAKEELLKFYLRMGFEDMEEEKGLKPIDGVMDLPLPSTLKDAALKVAGNDEILRCVHKGFELATNKAGNPKKELSKELYAAILLYTSNAIYADLNRKLREENRAAVKKYFSYLRLFLEAMAQLPQQASTLWRGISVDLFDQYKVGSTITWWGVSSCTSDQNVARNFMNGCGGKCSFLTIKAKTACDISQITFYASEKESLLAPGTQLLVKSSKKVGNVSEIVLEEVGRCIS